MIKLSIALDVGEEFMSLVALHGTVFVEKIIDLLTPAEKMPRAEGVGMAAVKKRPAPSSQHGRAFDKRYIHPLVAQHMSRETSGETASNNQYRGQFQFSL